MIFSLFNQGIFNTRPYRDITLSELIEIVKSPVHKKLVERIREEKDKERRDILKSKLDYATLSVTCNKREKTQVKEHSGFLQIDIDSFPGDWGELRNKIIKDEYTAALFDSPSGKLKIVIKIPKCGEVEHTQRFYAARSFFTDRWGLSSKDIDEKAKDIVRACYLSYDDKAYLNLDSSIFEGIDTTTKLSPPVDYSIITNGVQSGSRNDALFKLACSLRSKNVEQIHALVVLEEANKKNTPPLTGKEINNIIHSAYKYKEEALVQLPCLGNPISDFCLDLSQYFKEDKLIFFKPNEGNIVEHTTYHDVMLRRDVVGFKQVSAKRMLNLIESKVKTFLWVEDKKREMVKKEKSLNENTCSIVLENSNFTESLSKVNRMLNYPLLFLDTNNKLIIPSKGYDSRFQAYFTEETPEVSFMPVEQAKCIVTDLFSEFCFKDGQDRINAISYLITPACRGLYKRITARTPIFLIMANRERAGKDYLAGCVGIIYEGRAIDDPPICTGEKSSNDNEELRKKATSLIKQGRRRIHSSNNRGHIQNAVLEQLATSETWQDRELGHNKMITLDNELEISLSGNYGITYTPDFWHRARPINLFFSDEDPNSRKFNRPDLWGYVSTNRGIILSAIYTLINSWVEEGMPSSSECGFTSFPEWARVVGGVMMFHNLGNPCTTTIDQNITGDKETKDMKRLFELMYEKSKQIKGGITSRQITEHIMEVQTDEGIFVGYNFEEKSDKTKFGILLQKYNGREFSEIVMQPVDSNIRAARREYLFIKRGTNLGNLGNLGNLLAPSAISTRFENIIDRGGNVTNPTKVTKNEEQVELITTTNNIDIINTSSEDTPQSIILAFIKARQNDEKSNGSLVAECLEQLGENHSLLEKLRSQGQIIELPVDHWRVLE